MKIFPLTSICFSGPLAGSKASVLVSAAPSSLLGLNRLRKQSRVAADRLTGWFQSYAETMTTEPLEGIQLT